MAKVGSAICNGETGEAEEPSLATDDGEDGPMVVDESAPTQSVKPTAFKHLIGKGHPEFSTMRQQVRLI